MSELMNMKRVFEALLPKGVVWNPAQGFDFDKFLAAIGDNWQFVYEFLKSLANIRDPYTTPILSDLEREYGTVASEIVAEIERRNQLAAVVYAQKGTGSYGYLQQKLRAAGFNVIVLENSPPLDPNDYGGSGYLMYLGDTLSQLGEPTALLSMLGGNYVVNTDSILDPETGDPVIYEVPSDNSDRWRFVFFVAGDVVDRVVLLDWNMEKPGVADWILGPYTVATKDATRRATGYRSLLITTARNPVQQNVEPLQPDASLQMAIRMNRAPGNLAVANLAYVNFLVDGSMEATGVTAWTVGNSATLTKQSTSPVSGLRYLRVTYNGVTNPYAAQTILTIGKKYRIIGYARGSGNPLPFSFPRIVEGATIIWTGTISATWQDVDVTFTATGTVLSLQCTTSTAGEFAEFDHISVNEIPDLQDGDMEAAGTTAWSVGNSAVLTKDATDPFGGVQDLRVGYGGVANPYAYQTILSSNSTYGIRVFAKPDGGGNRAKVLFDNNLIFQASSNEAWEDLNLYASTTTETELRLQSQGGSGEFIDFDDVSMTPVLWPLITPNGPTDVATPFGLGMSFNGTSDWLNCGTAPGAGLTDNLTLAAWVKTTDTVGSIIAKIDSVGAQIEYGLIIQAGKLAFRDQGSIWSSSADIDDGEWHYVVAVVNSTSSLFYVDGVSSGSFVPSITTYGLTTAVGAESNGTAGFFAGEIVDPRIYGEYKTAAWVLNEYNNGLDLTLNGSYVEQIFEEVAADNTISGFAWGGFGPGESYPGVAARNASTLEWNLLGVGEGSTAKQSFDYTVPFAYDGVRLYAKGSFIDSVGFDDIQVSKPTFTSAQIPNESKDAFIRLILKYKPLHSWGLLLTDFV
jgi:hypothetical protein